jgi:hypothetical protein
VLEDAQELDFSKPLLVSLKPGSKERLLLWLMCNKAK